MVTPKKPDPDKTIFSPAEACYVIGLSWNTLRDIIKRGDIRAVRLKRRYLIPKEAITEYVKGSVSVEKVSVSVSVKRKHQ